MCVVITLSSSGSNSFRGFDFAGLGPRTKNVNGKARNGEIVGGKMFMY